MLKICRKGTTADRPTAMGAKDEFLRDIRLTGTSKKNYTLEPPSKTFSEDELVKSHICNDRKIGHVNVTTANT